MNRYFKSEQLHNNLKRVIPGGVNSPVRAFHQMGHTPVIIEKAQEDVLFDLDGNGYIDFCMSWGALIHGHANPRIGQEVKKRIDLGTSFGQTSPVEGQLAQLIVSSIPSIEKIRFVSSGTEATMSAIRLARGATKKPYLLKFSGNYHGHSDQLLVEAGSGLLDTETKSSSAGVPEEMVCHTITLPYNNIDSLEQAFENELLKDKIAAIILEPIAGNMGVVPGTREFIDATRRLTKEHNALLIFDEVITGFRVGPQGAQGLFEIEPDLTCFGKIIGGGFPVAAFGGRADIMDHLAPTGNVYQAGTLSGNPVAMEAGLQSIKLLQQDHFYEELENKVSLLLDPIKAHCKNHRIPCRIQQVGSMFSLFFSEKPIVNLDDVQEINKEHYKKLFSYMLRNGVYIPPSPYESWFISSAHTTTNLQKSSTLLLSFFEQIFHISPDCKLIR